AACAAVSPRSWVRGVLPAAAMVGRAAVASRRFTQPLVEMATVAERISQGEVHQEIVTHSSDEVGAMADAFRRMTGYLSEMATIAGRIAEGQFTGALDARSERDAMGQAFLKMLAYLREMAGVAAQIAEGDLRVDVQPRG